MYNVPSAEDPIDLRRYTLRSLVGQGSRSGLAGGGCGGAAYGLSAGLLLLFFKSPTTEEPSLIFSLAVIAMIPGFLLGAVLGIPYAWLCYKLCPLATRRRLLMLGGSGAMLLCALLAVPLIGVLEFPATIPAASIGGLIGGSVTALLFWRRLKGLAAAHTDAPQIDL